MIRTRFAPCQRDCHIGSTDSFYWLFAKNRGQFILRMKIPIRNDKARMLKCNEILRGLAFVLMKPVVRRFL